MTRPALAVLFAGLLGIPIGVGAFTFVYAKGFSYLSTDPRACVNCHVMNQQYDAWLKSGHRHTATCVECHLPHAGLAKWVAKADHGFRHSAAFTLQNFKEPIEITPRDREIVPRELRAVPRRPRPRGAGDAGAPGRGELDCLHCHAGAGPRRRRLTHGSEHGGACDHPSGQRAGLAAGRCWAWSGVAGLTVLLLALLTNIFERKQEARQPFVRLVEVTEDTMDPKVWGQNWPLQYDSLPQDVAAHGHEVRRPRARRQRRRPAEQKLDRDPWLKRIFAGYAFALDYRDRRGHAYALFDQEQTRRVTEKQQPGACLQCHAAILPSTASSARATSEGLRAGVRHAVPGGARHEGRQGPARSSSIRSPAWTATIRRPWPCA